MLDLFLQWSGNGLTSYYLVRVLNTIGISNPREQNILKGRLMIFNWITAVSSAFLTGPPETSNTVPVRLSGVHQSHAGRAIRILPKIEVDELVFCLPEKKWMSIYVHRAHLTA
jgi:hypothetical protein